MLRPHDETFGIRAKQEMKPALKWTLALGAAMAIGGPFLACSGPDISTWLISVNAPNESRDNIVFALPLYLLGLVLQLGVVLILQIGGVLIGLTGLIILIVVLVQWLEARSQEQRLAQRALSDGANRH